MYLYIYYSEFRYLPIATTWEPGIPILHTYICSSSLDG
jgi:hypothetical protein